MKDRHVILNTLGLFGILRVYLGNHKFNTLVGKCEFRRIVREHEHRGIGHGRI